MSRYRESLDMYRTYCMGVRHRDGWKRYTPHLPNLFPHSLHSLKTRPLAKYAKRLKPRVKRMCISRWLASDTRTLECVFSGLRLCSNTAACTHCDRLE